MGVRVREDCGREKGWPEIWKIGCVFAGEISAIDVGHYPSWVRGLESKSVVTSAKHGHCQFMPDLTK